MKIKESIPFATTTERINYLGINLPKETKEKYTENYKTLVKAVKDDKNRWIDIPCSWIGRTNVVKMTLLTNVICRLSSHQKSLFFWKLGGGGGGGGSVAKLCPTLCDTVDCSLPGFPVLHCLLEFAQIRVHSVMLSNHLILYFPPCPPALNLSQQFI